MKKDIKNKKEAIQEIERLKTIMNILLKIGIFTIIIATIFLWKVIDCKDLLTTFQVNFSLGFAAIIGLTPMCIVRIIYNKIQKLKTKYNIDSVK